MGDRSLSALGRIVRYAKRRLRAWRAMGWRPWRPLVGVWRPDKRPSEIAKALAMVGPSQRVSVVYMRTNDILVDRARVVGYMLKPGTDRWQRVVTRVPDIIDDSSYCWKNRAGREYLEKHCWCTNLKRNVIPKQRLQALLARDAEVSRYAIPTLRFHSVRELEPFVREHGDVVVKPVFSSLGRGVHRVTFDAATETFLVGFKIEDRRMSAEEFRAYAKESFFKKRHIAQEYVSSRTATGDPFDCRVHVEKNGRGEWQAASMLVRIGIGQKVISNINQGGGMAEIEPFLKANRPDCWQEVLAALNELVATVPAWFERQRGVELCTLGIDTAITADGSLRLFEINSLPFVDFNVGQVAMLRICYFRWLAEHRLGTR